MTTLQQRMQEDMKVRNLAPSTQASYIQHVSMFARHFDKSPESIGPEEIRSYQLYLSTEKRSAPPTVAIAVCALRFLYNVTLQRSWIMEEAMPMPKRREALPMVLSPDEVLKFLECVRQAKHRAILMSCYAAGLRISEVVRLKPGDIDNRMVIRVEQGKGRRDRYVMLSPRLLEVLEKWRASNKPPQWLFSGNRPENPITRHAVEKACREAYRLSDLSKPATSHSLRHAFAVHLLENGTNIRTIQYRQFVAEIRKIVWLERDAENPYRRNAACYNRDRVGDQFGRYGHSSPYCGMLGRWSRSRSFQPRTVRCSAWSELCVG